MAKYNDVARARMREEREETMSPRDKLAEARLAALPKPETAAVINLPEKRRMMPGKELPYAPNVVAFPGKGRVSRPPHVVETLRRATDALQAEADVDLRAEQDELFIDVERRGISSGPQILKVKFLSGASLDERVSFLRALAAQAKMIDAETVRQLQIYHALISQMRGPTGLPNEDKRVYIVVDARHTGVSASEWTGYIVDHPEGEGEGRLEQVLRNLVQDQREKLAAGKPDALERASEWFERVVKLIRRKS